MHVTIHIENSKGVSVKIFDEHVRTTDQCNLVNAMMKWAVATEIQLRQYVESMEEDP